MKVRLADGPGKCAGRVEIQYEGLWQRVRKEEWKDANSDAVCRELGCGNKRDLTEFCKGSVKFLAKTVTCANTAKKISECETADIAQPNDKEVEAKGITCEGECFSLVVPDCQLQ